MHRIEVKPRQNTTVLLSTKRLNMIGERIPAFIDI